jgi:hypothetical protein
MGKSTDYSESIKLIREAHGDAVAILEKWRELIDTNGEVTLTIKHGDGTEEAVTLPSIREAISRYLGGTFEEITLTDGTHTIIIGVNDNGDAVIRNPDGSAANLIAANITATQIGPRTGDGIAVLGTTTLSGGTAQNMSIQSLRARSCQILGAEFKGNTTITGGARIEGTAYIRNAEVQNLNAATVKYHKQVLKWGVTGIVDAQLLTSVNDGLWVGDPAVLERAGIFPEPTWTDCIYIPDPWETTALEVVVHLGDQYSGTVPIVNESRTITPYYAAMWPYKMYERVDGGYRIRWLPLDDQEGRIVYYRTGDTAAAGVGATVTMCDDLQVISALTGITANVHSERSLDPYACRRFIAMKTTETGTGTDVTDSLLYAT